MTDVEPVVSDFEATGRTGRRNALPDILGSTDGPGAADLPDKLAELSVGGTVCCLFEHSGLKSLNSNV
uniref:cAMP-dependent protein kinase inhibitor beta n=2 Tax=Sinocyclocheilus TaxID=75365 RepID=A0A671QS88_9TELE